MRILVVDDEPDVRDVIRRLLLPHAERIDVADSAEAAGALTLQDYDVMLVDIILPGLDGATFIRRLGERGVRARIVAMSGGGPGCSGLQALASAEALGADAILFKPFGVERLLDAVLEGTPTAV
ncbi:MAG TPA: response regulator [Azospirillum sp.]|nr:response regulator [Azospirillum sp.]